MSTEIKGTRNYSATVIRVPKVRKAENSDRLYIVDALGITAIVDESWVAREGQLALLFPAEVQLSDEFARANNLYRDTTQNADPAESGYLENNRRVRALKLRGNISNGLVLPISSLNYSINTLAYEVGFFNEGDVFDTLDGKEICRKYVVPVKENPAANREDSKLRKAFRRVDNTFLPEHFETGQWLREESTVPNDAELIITQKLHGTSVRLANTVVRRQQTKREKLAAKFLGARIADHEYDLVAGSRRAIKDPNNPNQDHYYKTDIWTEALKEYGSKIPKNVVLFGELVGYIPGTENPIQKGHTYEAKPGEFNLYIYRVAIITEDADLYDLSWDQVKAFCERHGFVTVPELDRMPKMTFDVEDYDEENFHDVWSKFPEAFNERPVALSPGGTGKDEGIAIRVETGLVPEIFKYKNKSHYEWETKELDTGEADLESQG